MNISEIIALLRLMNIDFTVSHDNTNCYTIEFPNPLLVEKK